MRSLILMLVPFALAMGFGDAQNWQSLGGPMGEEPVFTLVESDLGHIVAEIEVPGFWLSTFPGGGSSWDRVELPGCFPQGETGFPELPSVTRLFAMPFGTEAVLTVEDVEYSTFQGISLLPRQPSEIDMPHAPWPFEMNDRVYGLDEFLPVWALTDTDANWAGLHCGRLVVTPFRWNAATGELQAASTIRVRVDFEGAVDMIAGPVIEDAERTMAGTVVNFADFRQYTQTDNTRAGAEYIVICSAANRSAVAPLYELHNLLGLKVEVKTLTTPSNPGTIFGAIADSYETGITKYALIVGTHAEFPSYSYGTHVGDYYYACLTGGDLQPEIGVGRLTGDATQIGAQVTKIISGYLNFAWTDGNTTGITPSETVLAAHEEQYPGKYTQCCNEIAAFPYSLISMTFTKVYPPEGGTAQMVSDAINNSIGNVTYRGHGDVTVWSWSPGWSATNINNLTNAFKPPVFNIACLCGRYQETGNCLAESWQFATYGASGNLSANDPSYTEANHTYIKEIFKALYNTGTFGVTQAVNAATVITMATHGTYGEANAKMYLWFGDPAMEIWTFDTAGEPLALNMTGPSVLNPGTQNVTLTVTASGSPVSGATVVLTDGVMGVTNAQTFYSEGTTNASGQVTFNVTIPASGTIRAGAFKHDYRYKLLSWIVGVGVEDEAGAVPQLELGLPSPNPVTTSASITFSTPAAGRVELAVYDVTGRQIGTLVSGDLEAGQHTVEWQPGQVSNGVYFIRLTTSAGALSRQVMVVR